MGQPENGFQAAYVCFGEVLMREYAFRFAYDSLRVSRILQSSPWSMFFGGAFFVSLFGSGLLAVDFQAALQNVNFVNVMVGIMMVMLGTTG